MSQPPAPPGRSVLPQSTLAPSGLTLARISEYGEDTTPGRNTDDSPTGSNPLSRAGSLVAQAAGKVAATSVASTRSRAHAWTSGRIRQPPPDEVAEQRVAVLGQDRFGMELHALDRERAMAQAHDLLDRAVLVFGPCRHVQAGRQRRLLDHQRVVARRLERIGQAAEHAPAVVADPREIGRAHV